MNLIASETDEDRKASVIHLEEAHAKLERQKSTKEGKEIEASKDKPTAHTEKMAGGSVGFDLYLEYFKSGNSLLTIIVLVIGFISSYAAFAVCEVWLSKWTNDEEK